MAQVIRIKRHLGAKQAPTAAQVTVGELAYNKHEAAGAGGNNDLWVGDGSAPHLLVGADRQVELLGAQSITGLKTFTTMPSITGGAANDVLSTNGAGVLSWTAPLAIPPALILKGEFDASAPAGVGAIHNAVAPMVNGPVPAAATANHGFFFIVSAEGTITSGNAPHEHLYIGDWIVSTTGGWIHINLHFAIVHASNVAITTIPGMTGVADAQHAIEWLYGRGPLVGPTNPTTGMQNGDLFFNTTTNSLMIFNGSWVSVVPPAAAATVVSDQTSIHGDGAATGTYPATGPLTVALIDGSTY